MNMLIFVKWVPFVSILILILTWKNSATGYADIFKNCKLYTSMTS